MEWWSKSELVWNPLFSEKQHNCMVEKMSQNYQTFVLRGSQTLPSHGHTWLHEAGLRLHFIFLLGFNQWIGDQERNLMLHSFLISSKLTTKSSRFWTRWWSFVKLYGLEQTAMMTEGQKSDHQNLKTNWLNFAPAPKWMHWSITNVDLCWMVEVVSGGTVGWQLWAGIYCFIGLLD